VKKLVLGFSNRLIRYDDVIAPHLNGHPEEVHEREKRYELVVTLNHHSFCLRNDTKRRVL
jgi:hypothetical protein